MLGFEKRRKADDAVNYFEQAKTLIKPCENTEALQLIEAHLNEFSGYNLIKLAEMLTANYGYSESNKCYVYAMKRLPVVFNVNFFDNYAENLYREQCLEESEGRQANYEGCRDFIKTNGHFMTVKRLKKLGKLIFVKDGGNDNLSLICWEEILKMEPRNQSAIVYYISNLIVLGKISDAESFINNNNEKIETETLLDAIYDLNDNNSLDHYSQEGIAYSDFVIILCKKALEREPRNIYALKAYLKNLSNANRVEEAIELLKQYKGVLKDKDIVTLGKTYATLATFTLGKSYANEAKFYMSVLKTNDLADIFWNPFLSLLNEAGILKNHPEVKLSLKATCLLSTTAKCSYQDIATNILASDIIEIIENVIMPIMISKPKPWNKEYPMADPDVDGSAPVL